MERGLICMRAADGFDGIPNFAQVLLIIIHCVTGVEIFFVKTEETYDNPITWAI